VLFNKLSLPSKENALPGRDVEMLVENAHFVHGRPIKAAFEEQGYQSIYFGLGCFWGAERKFWSLPGVRTLLAVFFESHNPTQGMRQGNDKGTQYRSGVYYLNDQQRDESLAMMASYQAALTKHLVAGTDITTEVLAAKEFYYAETYHQQYLAKNPNGYCGLGGTGVSCNDGLS